MGQPIKLCTVANFINIHRTIFNWYYVTVLYSECFPPIFLGWIEQKILLLEQVDYFTRTKLNSNKVKKNSVVSISSLKIRVEEKCVTHAVLSFE